MNLLDGTCSRFEERLVELQHVGTVVESLRRTNPSVSVVLTSGSFDLLHHGHAMYLEAAGRLGDFLVVGVDSDLKVKDRKGAGRPLIPEMERARMVSHLRGVGLVSIKRLAHRRWSLIQAVRPDVLVVTSGAYSSSDISALGVFCGRVEVLPRFASVSTSATLRRIHLG